MTVRRLLAALPAVLTVAVAVVVAGWTAGSTAAARAQELPRFTAPVVDAAGALRDEVEANLNRALEDYRRRSGNQVAAAVVRTTGDRALEDYTIDLAREWGVGTRGDDNGVLLLIAMDDRRVRIEVGRGLEDELTDIESGRIIDHRIIPLLRAGDVDAAVEQGTAAIRQALGDEAVGELPPPPEGESDGDGGSAIGGLFPLLLLGFGVMSFMGNRRGRRRWGGGLPIVWGGSMGGGGWGGGGGGGGGFGGGGGGGFGGGGASGSW